MRPGVMCRGRVGLPGLVSATFPTLLTFRRLFSSPRNPSRTRATIRTTRAWTTGLTRSRVSPSRVLDRKSTRRLFRSNFADLPAPVEQPAEPVEDAGDYPNNEGVDDWPDAIEGEPEPGPTCPHCGCGRPEMLSSHELDCPTVGGS